jgi:hypothetical protein
VQISPRLNGLTWARGKTTTQRGIVSVSWKLTDKALNVQYTAPSDVLVKFVRNDTHKGLKVTVNGASVD